MAYDFYLDKVLLPITPSKLQLKIKNQNQTITLINEGEINILKKAGLSEVSFDARIPQIQYPFAVYLNGFKNAKTFLDHFEQLKTSQKPFQFLVSRCLPNGQLLFGTDMKVSLEDYTIKEDASDGFDLTVSIQLKQYREYSTQIVTLETEDKETVAIMEPQRETETAPVASGTTYTVAAGDCLWNIAKKLYGDGSRYREIQEANKDIVANPNLIYPGQVLTIP